MSTRRIRTLILGFAATVVALVGVQALLPAPAQAAECKGAIVNITWKPIVPQQVPSICVYSPIKDPGNPG